MSTDATIIDRLREHAALRTLSHMLVPMNDTAAAITALLLDAADALTAALRERDEARAALAEHLRTPSSTL